MSWDNLIEMSKIFLGLAYTLIAGHHWTSKIVNILWKHIQDEEESSRPFAYTAEIVGHIERVLYFFAIYSGFTEFIAVWLALKVAGKWARWETGTTDNDEEKRDIGRVFYNTFLIGSGLSLGYAFVGVNLVYLLLDKEKIISWIAPVALIVGSEILHQIILSNQDEGKTKGESKKNKKNNN